MHLTLQQATTMADAASAEASAHEMQPICVVVLDSGGHALALKRDERASIHRHQIATAKAAGCLGMGFGSRELQKRAKSVPSFFAALNSIFTNGIVPVPGGVLIRADDGALLDAVGISGDTSDNDELCAAAGVRAVSLQADTGL